MRLSLRPKSFIKFSLLFIVFISIVYQCYVA